jgi:hypothetical protein
VIDAARTERAQLLRGWWGMLLIAVVVITILWPAGVFKLDILRTFRFRVYDSSAVARNLPWWSFYSTLFRQAPAYTLVIFAGLVAFGAVWLRKGSKVEKRRSRTNSYLISMLPFLVYIVTVFLLSFKQRLVYVHHIADMFAPATVLAVSAIVVGARSLMPPARSVVLGLGVIGLIFSVFAAASPDPTVVGPQEHPGMIGVCDFLAEYPNSRTYYHFAYAVEYYSPGANVEGGFGRRWTIDGLAAVKERGYDFVISHQVSLDENFPSIGAVAAVLSPEYELAKTIRHRRTDEPVIWIFSRSVKTQ